MWNGDLGHGYRYLTRLLTLIEPEPVQPDSWARGILKVSHQVPVVEKENAPLVSSKQWKASTIELKVPAPKSKIQMTKTVVKRQVKSKEIIEPVKRLSTDQMIKQENRKLLDRIQNMEKYGGSANYAYDHDGRIILLKKTAPIKAFSPQVSVSLVDEKESKKNKPVFRKYKKADHVQKTQDLSLNLNEGYGFVPDDSLEIPCLVIEAPTNK